MWAVAYLVGQSAAVLGWWLAMAASPWVRERFELNAVNRDTLSAFVVADLVVVTVGSLAASVALWRRWPWSGIVLGVVAGGLIYATLWLGLWVLLTGDGGVGVPPMVMASLATAASAVRFR